MFLVFASVSIFSLLSRFSLHHSFCFFRLSLRRLLLFR